MSFYDYTLTKRDGSEVSLKEYEGKVVIVVNTATGCGFTPQYKDLEATYEKYHDKGLEIIDIPCNQFANQTPGTDDEVHEFCTMKYKTQFDQYKKSDVNGENALPVYAFLKAAQAFKGFKGISAPILNAVVKKNDPDFKNNPDIKWNFTKFVVNRNGEVVARFEPTDSMKDLDKLVGELL